MVAQSTPFESSLLEIVFENTHTMMAYLDSDFNFVRVNQAYAQVDGHPPPYFVGKNHFEMYPSEENQALFTKVLNSGVPHHEEARGFSYEYNPERGMTYWDLSLYPAVSQGEINGVLLVLVDVSKRVNAEQLLKKAQEIGHFGTWDWDLKKDTVQCTEEMKRIFRISENDVAEKITSYMNVIHPDDFDYVKQKIDMVLTKPEQDYLAEYRLLFPNGEVTHIYSQGRVFCDVEGKPARVLGTVQDITEKKLADIELEKHRNHLEDLVEERARELKEAQHELIQAARMATLGSLTATVSHELRNPLAAMTPSTYILRKLCDLGNDKVKNAIDVIERNIERCDQIIDDLLGYAQNDTGLTKTNFVFDPWLKQILSEQDIPKDVDVQLDLGIDDHEVAIDPERFRRVVQNLVSNAIAAMYVDPISRTIKPGAKLMIKSRLKNQEVRVSVADNGTGIEPDKLDKVFEPLFSTKSFGVGLGMPIAKHVVEQHQGQIVLNTVYGQGTCVEIKFPQFGNDGEGQSHDE
ncbi:MAG: ATP-binding protein [Gammaproteobacteria bacterium]|nr:ATP-binding protein [Gammaproteobacteria bacterium]